MSDLFGANGSVYKFMQRIYQILLLDVLVIISSIPIITIGAAISSGYGTAFKVIRFEEKVLYKDFFERFKKNFKQATIVWLVILAFGLIIFWFFGTIRNVVLGNQIVYYLLMLVIAIISISLPYVFPLISRFENTIPNTLKNALILSIKHLPFSILIFLITIGMTILPIYIPKLFFVWIFLGVGTSIYLTALIFNKIFSSYEESSD